MSIFNAAGVAGGALGAGLTSALGVDATHFENLGLLVTICNIGQLIPLAFLGLLDGVGEGGGDASGGGGGGGDGGGAAAGDRVGDRGATGLPRLLPPGGDDGEVLTNTTTAAGVGVTRRLGVGGVSGGGNKGESSSASASAAAADGGRDVGDERV